jgi:hypothetical protein
VVARPIAAMALAGGAFIGVIAYTHAQPDGPHAVKGYIEVVPPEQWEAWRIGQ